MRNNDFDMKMPRIVSLLTKQAGAFRAVRNNPLNAIPMILYIITFVALYINRKEMFNVAAFGMFAPVASMAITVSLVGLGVIGLFCVNGLVSMPYRFRNTEIEFRKVGFTNARGETPRLLSCSLENGARRIRKLVFDANGIPLINWKDKQDFVELALNLNIINTKYNKQKNRIEIFAVDGDVCLPDFVSWNDEFLSSKNFEIVLGEGLAGQVVINLAKVPGVLIAGATGSGKTLLFSSLLYQAFEKGAGIILADFKGGIDFPASWSSKFRLCTEKDELLECLLELSKIQEHRKQLFVQAGARNIDEYNKKASEGLRRYVLACDEIAEVLQKTGLNKEEKEQIYKIAP